MCSQGDEVGFTWIFVKFSTSEEMLLYEDVRHLSSRFIMHTVHGGTDLGARARKVTPAG